MCSSDLPEPAPEPAPEPVPEPATLASVTLIAVLDDATQTPFPGALSWVVTGGDTPVAFAETGNLVTRDLGQGTFQVTATSAVDGSVGTATFGVIGNSAVMVTVLMPVALPLATLDAPDQAPAGSTIMVGWTGPNDNNDNIEVGLPGVAGYISYAYTRDGNPVSMILPGQPGVYELRYKLRDAEIIAARVITVTEALVQLTAPDTAPIGSTIDVGWTGPAAPNDNIELGRVGEPGYIDFVYVTEGNPVQIIMPAAPGTYELRYRFRDAETLVSRLIAATEVQVTMTAPDTAPAGATIDVGWSGPAAENDNIELGRVGEAGYIDYAYVTEGNPVQIILPADPGTYELRYRFRDSETISSRLITVTAVDVILTAPDTAPAGSTIAVGWVGPNAENDNIQIAKPGGTYLEYTYVRDGNPVQLRLPPEPGTYELSYRFRDTDTIATRRIDLTPITAQLSAQATATPGENIIVGWDGPNYANDYIAIGRLGDLGYDNYSYTLAGNPVTVLAPMTPGDYEIRYITRDIVLTTIPLLVK